MNALTTEFLTDGFKVLGFPCNDFNLQEPGNTASEILGGLAWVRPGNGYMPKFQMFKKIDVNGENEDKLYTYLKSTCGPTSDTFQDLLFYKPIKVSDVRWNFEVFLINKMGVPVYRYSPDHDIMSIAPEIRALLNQPIETIVRKAEEDPKVEQSNAEPVNDGENTLGVSDKIKDNRAPKDFEKIEQKEELLEEILDNEAIEEIRDVEIISDKEV